MAGILHYSRVRFRGTNPLQSNHSGMLLVHRREEHSSEGQQHLTFWYPLPGWHLGTRMECWMQKACQNGSQTTLERRVRQAEDAE